MTVTAAAGAAMNAQETEEVFLAILEIDHDTLAAPIRVVNNTENIVSNGDTYVAWPFEMDLPDDDPGAVVRVQLAIDNVGLDGNGKRVSDYLREISGIPTVALSVIMASDPDDVQAGPFELSLHHADYDGPQVTGELVFQDLLNEPFPGISFTPATTPGLF